MVYHQYLWMHVFVWARVFCGTRYYQSGSLDYSGAIQKIHMRKIERQLGIVNMMEYDRFHDEMTLDKPKWMFHGPGVCADAQCCKITWLEELASESNTIQAQEDICRQGKIVGKYK